MTPERAFTIGVEEEYLLVHRATGDLVEDTPPELMAECERRLAGQVTPEFLRSQIEVGTRVCTSLSEVRADLARLRRFALNPIRANPDKGSTRGKIKRAAWNDTFLLDLLHKTLGQSSDDS